MVSCEGTGASLWFPNKDHLSDEPDSVRISCAVPKGLTCVSNGNLRSTKELKPDYQYTNFRERKHKFNFRVPAGTNEQQEAASQGWYRIYDSGKKKWELNCD